MPREASGELRPLASGGYEARITIEGRRRRGFVLGHVATEAEAEERCKAMAQIAARLRRAQQVDEIEKLLEMAARARPGRPWDAVNGAVDALCAGTTEATSAVPTFEKFAEEWTDGTLAKRFPDFVKEKRSAERDEELLRLYVNPHIGSHRLDDLTLADCELVMANLPPHLSGASRRHVAQVMSRVLHLAVYPGKHRKESPLPRGWLPKPGPPKAKECLYPDEDALLLGGQIVKPGAKPIPALRRFVYGFPSREGMRVDEAVSLQWRDMDLQRGRVILDKNKTDDPRDWDLRPDVAEALKRWRDEFCTDPQPDDYVFAENGVPLNAEHLADQVRADLLRVGVTRPQLFERSKARQPIRAHDLRATFVTISLATGKGIEWVTDRTGHKSLTMVNKYRRKARTWNLGGLGPLHDLIPELRSTTNTPRIAPKVTSTGGETGRRSGFRFRRREA